MAWTCKTGNNPKGCGGISGFATPDDGQFGAAAPDLRLRFDERYGIAVLQFYGTLEGNWLCGNPATGMTADGCRDNGLPRPVH